jgi:hypothetical protein
VKPSVSYSSGKPERLRPEDITSVPAFTEYARQELGLSYPVGKGRREGWMKHCLEEMVTQDWDFVQLVAAVQYIKAKRASCRTLHGILYYVDEAALLSLRAAKQQQNTDLHANVADALQVERDEGWRRRLSLAQGQALAMVYDQWRLERA